MTHENAISVRNLTKVYRDGKTSEEKHALKSVSLDIKRGSFFGLLGSNGAGKSTMINIIAGLVHKTSGEVLISGYDIEKQMRAARTAIGVVPQELVLDTFFTVRQALEIHAGYYGVPKENRRTDELIEAMGLTDKADVNSRRLSGGMRRRLLIAKALVHQPDVLILDEPTAGVDVDLRNHLWDYVKQLNEQGTTIVLTTHYLEEAEELCDEIAIINHGEIITHTSKTELMGSFDSKQIMVRTSESVDTLPKALADKGWKLEPTGMLSLTYPPSSTSIMQLLEDVKSEKLSIADISTTEANLEDIFLGLTKAS